MNRSISADLVRIRTQYLAWLRYFPDPAPIGAGVAPLAGLLPQIN
jgi:hypothetical protein